MRDLGSLGRSGRVGIDGTGSSSSGGRGIVSSLLSEESLLASWGSGGGTGDGSSVVVESTVLLDVSVVSSDGGRGELSGRKLKSSEVELGQLEQVNHGKDGLGKNVEDTVEDHLRVGRDDISTVGKTPGDGVKQPEEREDGGRGGEGRLVSGTKNSSRDSSGTREDPPDVEEGDTSKGEVTPFVGRLNKTSNETGDDHDQVEEDQGDDVGEGKTGGEDQGEEQGGGSNDPVCTD